MLGSGFQLWVRFGRSTDATVSQGRRGGRVRIRQVRMRSRPGQGHKGLPCVTWGHRPQPLVPVLEGLTYCLGQSGLATRPGTDCKIIFMGSIIVKTSSDIDLLCCM